MYPTPVVSDHLHNQSESIENWTKRAEEKKKQGINLHFALRHHVQMYPTPTRGMYKQDVKDNGEYARSIKEKGHQIMLPAFMKLYPTPVARDHKDAGYNTTWKESRDQKSSLPRQVLKDNKPGGRLNPNFVEFLMGYPMNWTKIDPTE